MLDSISIRKGEVDDIPSILELIEELAEYEHAEPEVIITSEDLERDGFGPSPKFNTLVALNDNAIVGMALFYERYSTWKGPTLYLEDLIVTDAHRGKGAGGRLMTEMISIAKQGGYRRLEWQVLEWNTRAIEFYKRMQVEIDETWYNCRMIFE